MDKQKGVSLCRMARVFKPTKCGLKINFIIGWIDGLGLILWTPRLSEWSRLGLASLFRRPELTWCHCSANPRNPLLLKDPPIFPRFYPFSSVCNDLGRGNRESAKFEIIINEATIGYLHFNFCKATSTNSVLGESFIKYDSELIILTGSPPSRKFLWWVGKPDKGKRNT